MRGMRRRHLGRVGTWEGDVEGGRLPAAGDAGNEEALAIVDGGCDGQATSLFQVRRQRRYVDDDVVTSTLRRRRLRCSARNNLKSTTSSPGSVPDD